MLLLLYTASTSTNAIPPRAFDFSQSYQQGLPRNHPRISSSLLGAQRLKLEIGTATSLRTLASTCPLKRLPWRPPNDNHAECSPGTHELRASSKPLLNPHTRLLHPTCRNRDLQSREYVVAERTAWDEEDATTGEGPVVVAGPLDGIAGTRGWISLVIVRWDEIGVKKVRRLRGSKD